MMAATAVETLRAEVIQLEVEVESLYQEAVRRDQALTQLQDRLASVDYADSEYKFLSSRGPYIRDSYRWFAQSWMNHALLDELDGAGSRLRTPPRSLSDGQRDAFAMGADVPILDTYFAAPSPCDRGWPLTASSLEAIQHALAGTAGCGSDAPPPVAYRQAIQQLQTARDPIHAAIASHVHSGQQVAVYGSTVPVYEALCLKAGARPTSISPGCVGWSVPEIAVASEATALAEGHRFDCLIAGWRIAQAGMGRFDELTPDGDLALMARLWRLVAPGGVLILGLPTGPDLVAYCLLRIYGQRRLPLLLRGCERIDQFDDSCADDLADRPRLVAFVLRRAGSASDPEA